MIVQCGRRRMTDGIEIVGDVRLAGCRIMVFCTTWKWKALFLTVSEVKNHWRVLSRVVAQVTLKYMKLFE